MNTYIDEVNLSGEIAEAVAAWLKRLPHKWDMVEAHRSCTEGPIEFTFERAGTDISVAIDPSWMGQVTLLDRVLDRVQRAFDNYIIDQAARAFVDAWLKGQEAPPSGPAALTDMVATAVRILTKPIPEQIHHSTLEKT